MCPVNSGAEPRHHEDDLAQHDVLMVLLDAHPGLRSADELVRELSDRPDHFPERDRVENAIRELVGAGLVHRHGEFLFATHSAVRFNALCL